MTAHQRLPLFEFFLLHTSHLDHEIGPEHPTREFSDEQAYRTTWKGLELGLSKMLWASSSVFFRYRWPQVAVHVHAATGISISALATGCGPRPGIPIPALEIPFFFLYASLADSNVCVIVLRQH
jgi:hypothetical protein